MDTESTGNGVPDGDNGMDGSRRRVEIRLVPAGIGGSRRWHAIAAVLFALVAVSVLGWMATGRGTPSSPGRGQDTEAVADGTDSAGEDAAGSPSRSGEPEGDDPAEDGIGDTMAADESGIRSQRLLDRIVKGKMDVREITSGDLERGGPFEAADESTLPYVAYPPDGDGRFHVDTIRIADGRFSFDMPTGFWIVDDASSDNPCIRTFIRNDGLDVTVGIGHGESDRTAGQIVDEWMGNASPMAHSGIRYSRRSKGGLISGLVWHFAFDEVNGKRRAVAELPDGSMMYVEVLTDPWPEYERDGDPHVAHWIHEFLNSVQMLNDKKPGQEGSQE